jgi:hypothetical protein
MLGGHSAEDLIFGQVTTGAGSDLEQVTRMARRMVTEYGMSDKLGPRTFGNKQEMDFSLPEELRTGTDLDEYMMLVQGVAVYAQSLMQFDQDGKELKKASDYFEEEFLPGTLLGVRTASICPGSILTSGSAGRSRPCVSVSWTCGISAVL